MIPSHFPMAPYYLIDKLQNETFFVCKRFILYHMVYHIYILFDTFRPSPFFQG